MTADLSLLPVAGVSTQRAEAAVRELLFAVGEDPDREGLRDTPARVARAYQEMFAGLFTDPGEVLETMFDENHDELVLVKDIPLYSVMRAPPRPVVRHRSRRLHPRRVRPDHRLVQTGPIGGPVRQTAPDPGAVDLADRRYGSGATRGGGRHRRGAGRTPLHGDARDPQARQCHAHLSGAGRVQVGRSHPRRSDESGARAMTPPEDVPVACASWVTAAGDAAPSEPIAPEFSAAGRRAAPGAPGA